MSNNITEYVETSQVAPQGDTVTSQLMSNMAPAMKFADAMAQCTFLPDAFKENPGNCFMVISQALRWNMDPFSVAQCASNIQGKLMFEGKLVGAAINSSPKLSGSLNYKYEGEGNQKTCTCFGFLKGENEPREVTVQLDKVRTKNAQWAANPDQMLSYFSARVWARRHMPEVMLGVYSPDEFPEDVQHSSPTPRHVSKQPPQQIMERQAEVPKAISSEQTRQRQLTQAFIKKAQGIQSTNDMDAWLASEGTTKWLGQLDREHPELAKHANAALQKRSDELMQEAA